MADGTTASRKRPRKEAALTTPDPIEIAMNAEAMGEAPRGVAHRVLAKQEQLIGWEIADRRAAFGLKMLASGAALIGATLVAGMIWSASRADGLVIKAFSVPPTLAARGVTGEALAAQTMDRLNRIAGLAISAEQQRRVSGDWGQNISIQIPDTGVSISQLDQWLRDRVGKERRVTGEVMLGDDGRLTLVSRSGALALPEQTGAPAELPAMLQRAAESLYAHEQPLSYSSYLQNQERWADLESFARRQIASRSRRAQAFGYADLGAALRRKGDAAGSAAAYERSVAIDATVVPGALRSLFQIERDRGHETRPRSLRSRYVALLNDRRAYTILSETAREQRLSEMRFVDASERGDFAALTAEGLKAGRTELMGFGIGGSPVPGTVGGFAEWHDITAARALLASYTPPAGSTTGLTSLINIAVASEDWTGALSAYDELLAQPLYRPTASTPARRARVLAELGRISEAETLIGTTPPDCAPCVLVRGQVAQLAGRPRDAEHWFGEAARIAPHSRSTPYEWGRARLARGELPAAIAQFKTAEALAPKWADPVLSHGEALLAQSNDTAAAAKFRDAARLAPRWGRAQLRWGEALAAQGKADEARAKWAAAAGMDLTPSERAELVEVSRKQAR